MIQNLFQKNISNISPIDILYVIFLCGFLLPKFQFLGFHISISDILSLFFSFLFFLKLKKLDKKILYFFKFELIISLTILFLLYVNQLIYNNDAYSYFYTVRIITYILASIYIIQISGNRGINITSLTINIVILYSFLYILFIFLNISKYSLDEILYGYTEVRFKLPYEYSGSTSVPLAYLLSLIFAYLSKTKKASLIILFLAQIFTVSRAAIISSSILLIVKYKKYGYLIVPLSLFFVLYKTLISNELDHSSSDRITFATYSIYFYLNDFPKSFFGYGLSPNILYSNTGYFYYENIFSQVLMSGGILYFLVIVAMYINFSYRILFLKRYIYIPVLLGNFLGGYNLLSTISLPIYFMLAYYYDEN